MNILMHLLKVEILGVDLINSEDFFELLLRFTLNTIVQVILIRYLYYPVSRRKDYLFTYFLIGFVVFLLCVLLDNVKLELGFALGLFAVFGIIRYRTITIPIKEMTYLFVVIGLAVINALANKKVSYAELMFTNFALLMITFGLEKIWLLRHESRKTIVYEKIDLIRPENFAQLKADLEERTGLSINRIDVGNIDFMRDSARIKIFYYEQDNKVNEANDFSGSDDGE